MAEVFCADKREIGRLKANWLQIRVRKPVKIKFHTPAFITVFFLLISLLCLIPIRIDAFRYQKPKVFPVVTRSLQDFATELPADSSIHIWVYFTDKGFSSREGLDRRLAAASELVTERARSRRRQRGTMEVSLGYSDVPVHEEYVQTITKLRGVERLRTESRWFNAVSLAVRKQAIPEIAGQPFVRMIDVVKRAHRQPVEKTPPQTERQTEAISTVFDNRDYGSSFDQLKQINALSAHARGYTGKDILVLMLDTGFFKEHEAVDTRRIVDEWDFIQNDNDTADDSLDAAGQQVHGTMTMSVLGGAAEGALYGPAFECDFLLAKTEIVDQEIQLEEDLFVEALEWGEGRGADVASSSLGYFDWYEFSDMDGNTAIITRAVDMAVKRGVVCVTAVGNENVANKNTIGYGWDHIIAPADADSVISVGAVNAEGTIAGFSSRGPTFDGRIKPEVVARGVNVVTASGYSPIAYGRSKGTSFSTPLVAGAAALVLQAHPSWSPFQVRRALMETANNAIIPNNVYGWGVIDAMKAIEFEQPTLADLVHIQNYPNPFSSYTFIKFPMADSLRQMENLRLEIYNIRGERITTLRSPNQAGIFEWIVSEPPWRSLPNGVYISRLVAGSVVATNKMTLLR